MISKFEIANKPVHEPKSQVKEVGEKTLGSERPRLQKTPSDLDCRRLHGRHLSSVHCVLPIHFMVEVGDSQSYAVALQTKDHKGNRVGHKRDMGEVTWLGFSKPDRHKAQKAVHTRRFDSEKEEAKGKGLVGRVRNRRAGPNEKKRCIWVEEEKWVVGSSPMQFNKPGSGQDFKLNSGDYNPTRGKSSGLKKVGVACSEDTMTQKEEKGIEAKVSFVGKQGEWKRANVIKM